MSLKSCHNQLQGGELSSEFLRYTVELQWHEHLRDHENMFQTGVVRANEYLSSLQNRRQSRGIISIFFHMKVYCVFSLESPH